MVGVWSIRQRVGMLYFLSILLAQVLCTERRGGSSDVPLPIGIRAPAGATGPTSPPSLPPRVNIPRPIRRLKTLPDPNHVVKEAKYNPDMKRPEKLKACWASSFLPKVYRLRRPYMPANRNSSPQSPVAMMEEELFARVPRGKDVTVLMVYAIYHGLNREAVKYLECGACPEGTLENDCLIPLYICIENNDVEMVKKLLDFGANANRICVDYDRRIRITPLHAAVTVGNLQIVECLVAAGAKPDLASPCATPLPECVPFKASDVKEYGLLQTAFLNRSNIDLDLLKKTGVIDSKDYDSEMAEELDLILTNYTLFFRACVLADPATVHWLYVNGADHDLTQQSMFLLNENGLPDVEIRLLQAIIPTMHYYLYECQVDRMAAMNLLLMHTTILRMLARWGLALDYYEMDMNGRPLVALLKSIYGETAVRLDPVAQQLVIGKEADPIRFNLLNYISKA